VKRKTERHFDEWFVDGGWYWFLAALLLIAYAVSMLVGWMIGG